MRSRPSLAIILFALALTSLWAGALNPIAAQPVTPPAPTPTPPIAQPAVSPTLEPPLTVPEAIDRLLKGDRPVATIVDLVTHWPLEMVVGTVIVVMFIGFGATLFKRWMERGVDAADRSIADWYRRRSRSPIDRYLRRLEQDMLRLAKIPALGREQRELNLEQVYVPLYVVEREQMETFERYSRGDLVADDDDDADPRKVAYRAVRESRPVFRLLSDPDHLPSEPPPRPVGRRSRWSWLERFRLALRRFAFWNRRASASAEPTTSRLLLVGRAGSGKTTTLHFGALMLARAVRDGKSSELRKRLQLYTRSVPFPIYARLTELMDYVRAHHARQPAALVGAPASLFLDALDELARRDVSDLPTDAIKRRVQAGGCLIMLDGLDETGDAIERGHAMDLIASLVAACPQNRYLVASRPFEGLGERLDGFTERHLRPLDADDIRRLLNRLFRALRLQDAPADEDTDRLVPEAAELWRNLERNPRLFDMATNPLLLTSMAVLVEGREPLPVERAKIYEKLVRLTIEAWRKAQLGRDRVGADVKLFEESDDSVRLRLQLLAADMLEKERREITLAQARDLLRPVYQKYYPDWNEERCNDYVRDLLAQIALHSGLLQARDVDNLFNFAHFTLQEYLAARYYTEGGADKDTRIAHLIERWPQPRWRETILLAIGHEATSGDRETARRMVQQLWQTGDPAAIMLAGDALDEANARAVGELNQQRQDVAARLGALAGFTPDWATAAHPDPRRRNRAATLLDRLDPDHDRPELDLTSPAYWAARIEPGWFSMGDDDGRYQDEKPQFRCAIRRPYALARFPVTNRQYLRFLEALAGRGPAAAVAAARNLIELIERRGETLNGYGGFRPYFWPGARYRAGEGNHPVVGVRWYAAAAFAWWADAWLRAEGVIGPGEAIRLPTEPEWERAAAYPPAMSATDPRAGRRQYPWGDAWEHPRFGVCANTRESGIGGPSAVGIFPHGAAACGAAELAGNVWEWCSTLYQLYPLPADAQATTFDTAQLQQRVKKSRSLLPTDRYALRGGSWNGYADSARCASRFVSDPDIVYGNVGFRLARLFSLASS